MTVQEHAKEYLALGWSVFPLRNKLKTPGAPWNDYRTQRLTNEEVDKVFRADSNIALACGELSGILVVDQDLYKGKPGLENIDSPLKAITPRGGIHLYFKYTPGSQNTVNDKKGTDIRSEGGYVVLPPSTIDLDDGRTGQYMWVTFPTKELLESLPEPPKSLLDAVYEHDTTQTPSKPLLTPIGEDFGPVGEGGRNNEISRFSLSMLNRYKDPVAVWQLVLARNATFTPPLPINELRLTFESAAKKFVSSPPTKQAPHISNDLLEQVREKVDFVPTTLKSDVDFTIQQLIQGKKQGYSTGYLELDSLMGGFIPSQSYLIFADTNVGKSMMAVNMLVSMAKRGVKCLYFDLENDTAFSTERIMMVANGGQVNLTEYRAHLVERPVNIDYLKSIFKPVYEMESHLDVWSMTKMLDRFGEITWAGIKTVMDEKIKDNVQVVVIDHLHYFSPAETDHAVLGEIARQINNYAAEYNIAIACVAHTKKGLTENKKGKDDNQVRVIRPTIDHISGSAMIAKHFKNLISIQRNYAAESPEEQTKTKVYVDKTKYGPSGSFDLVFDPSTFLFKLPSYEAAVTKMKTQAIDEMLEDAIKLPLEVEPEPEEEKPPPVIVDVPPQPVPEKKPLKIVVENRTPLKKAEDIRKVDDSDIVDIPF